MKILDEAINCNGTLDAASRKLLSEQGWERWFQSPIGPAHDRSRDFEGDSYSSFLQNDQNLLSFTDALLVLQQKLKVWITSQVGDRSTLMDLLSMLARECTLCKEPYQWVDRPGFLVDR